jgi:hypothetical protein
MSLCSTQKDYVLAGHIVDYKKHCDCWDVQIDENRLANANIHINLLEFHLSDSVESNPFLFYENAIVT